MGNEKEGEGELVIGYSQATNQLKFLWKWSMGKASDMNKVPDGAREVWEVLTVGQVTWRIIEKHATIVAAVLVYAGCS